MKKLITMIGMGAILFMVPSCKKSMIMPHEGATSQQAQQKDPGTPLPTVNNTSMYVMLASKPCVVKQSEYTSLTLDIRGIRVYSDEKGWVSIPTLTSGWDLVRLQQGDIPGANITDRMEMTPGRITKMAITFGDNHNLWLNNKQVSCFQLGAGEVMLDIRGEVKKDAVNELKIAMDICGNIDVQTNSDDGSKCYVLKPMVEYQGVTQKMIK